MALAVAHNADELAAAVELGIQLACALLYKFQQFELYKRMFERIFQEFQRNDTNQSPAGGCKPFCSTGNEDFTVCAF